MAQPTVSQSVARWKWIEIAIESAELHDRPVQAVQVTVEFSGPTGASELVRAFWDGGRTWRVRFCPDEVGTWTYRTRCEQDAGLDGVEGTFECVPYEGENPLYRHGDVRVSEDRYHLVHADGTPFLWLGDTAWNGALLADEQAWRAYLSDRRRKGFTGIQFVTTQWRAASADAEGRAAFSGVEKIKVNPRFFRRMDRMIDAINDAGLVAAPVLLWALGDSPGRYLPEDQRIVLASYMVARYGAHQVIWILGGDGNYRDENAEPWKRIGRAVFGDHPRGLVTMHPGGRQWIAEEFRNEPWFGFNCYQSGHGDGDDHLRWLCEGPPATEWAREPRLPNLNFEPNYEGHHAYQSGQPFDAHAVRRAAYWSLLIAPPAGLTYGAHGIWGWHQTAQVAPDHPNSGVGPAWFDAMRLPGATCIKHLHDLFASFEWWRLRPDTELVVESPGREEITRHVVAARSESGDLAVLYSPVGGTIRVDLRRMNMPIRAEWFDPSTGGFYAAHAIDAPTVRSFDTPTDGDHVLILRAGGR